MNGLLPTDDPGVEGVFHKLKGLLLNIRKARLFQVAHHVGRDSENSSDLIDLEFACFQELCLLRRDADGRVLHAFFQYGDLIGVAAATEGRLPALPHTLRVFDGAGVFQHTTRCGTVGEEFRAILLTGNRHADSILCHSDGAVANQAIEAESGDMQHIRRLKRYGELLVLDSFVRATIIGVVQTAVFVSVHGHLIRHQRVQSYDLIFAVANDLCISVTPEEQMCHERFAEHERAHLRVWLIVEQAVERMVERHCFATAVRVFIKVQRQSCDSFRQDADAGIHGGHLHGRAFRYRLAGCRAAHEKGVVAARCAILGFISRFEQS